jgi:hypothetical protein
MTEQLTRAGSYSARWPKKAGVRRHGTFFTMSAANSGDGELIPVGLMLEKRIEDRRGLYGYVRTELLEQPLTIRGDIQCYVNRILGRYNLAGREEGPIALEVLAGGYAEGYLKFTKPEEVDYRILLDARSYSDRADGISTLDRMAQLLFKHVGFDESKITST